MSQPTHTTGPAFERLGPASFGAYLLGAVVPLVALAVVVQSVLPTLADPVAAAGLVGLVVSIAALSLGSFLMMRRATRRSLARMESDYRRLAALLEASTALAGAGHCDGQGEQPGPPAPADQRIFAARRLTRQRPDLRAQAFDFL